MRTLEKYANLNLLWIFPIIVPLGTILLSFYLQEWYWGLVDDATILSWGHTVRERFINDFGTRLSNGRVQFLFSLRSALFYTWFENSPTMLHLLKWVEATMTLLVWGLAIKKISGRLLGAVIFASITLSFNYFYDTFFFISLQDVLGLLFLGIGFNCCLSAFDSSSHTRAVTLAIFGILGIVLGVTTNERMTAIGLAYGLGFILVGLMGSSNYRRALILGVSIFGASVTYALFLKLYMQPEGGHTSTYSITNFSRMGGNIIAWITKDVLNHSPWLLGLAILASHRGRISKFATRQKWGMLFGGLQYFLFLLLLIPWMTISYVAGPLGVLFAFPVSIYLAHVLPQSSINLQVLAPVAALLFNMLICQRALTRESLYHYDTQNLMTWVRGNPEFQLAADGGLVYCNAWEGGGAIPAHLARDFGVLIPGFTYKGLDQSSFRAGQIMVYTPRFGSDTDTFSPDFWETQFYSKFWQVYVHK